MYIWGDFETFLIDNEDRMICFQVYKRVYTQYEQQKAFADETEYTSIEMEKGYIREAVNLCNGDWLLGIENVYEDFDSADEETYLTFYRLSELRMIYSSAIEKQTKETWNE